MQSAIQIKLTTSHFTRSKCADKELFFKHGRNRVYHIDFMIQLYYLLVVAVNDVKVIIIHCRCNICCKLTTQLLHEYNSEPNRIFEPSQTKLILNRTEF